MRSGQLSMYCIVLYVNNVVMQTNLYLHKKSSEVCIKARSAPASLLIRGSVTEHGTVKWSIPVTCAVIRCDRRTLRNISCSLPRFSDNMRLQDSHFRWLVLQTAATQVVRLILPNEM